MKKIRLGKRGLAFIIIGTAAYLYFLLANIPASTVYALVEKQMGHNEVLNLQGLSGTVWSGQAAQARIAKLNLGRLDWQLNLFPLLTGKLSLDVLTTGNDSRMQAGIKTGLSGRTLTINNMQGKLPVQLLMPFLYGLPIAVDGQIAAEIKHAEIEQGEKLSVEGKLVWQNAALTAPQAIKFGDLFLAIRPDKNGSKILLSDQGGPLAAEGTVMVKHSGEYKLNIYLAARDKNDAALNNALKLLGRTNSQGKVLVSRTGRLQGWAKK